MDRWCRLMEQQARALERMLEQANAEIDWLRARQADQPGETKGDQ